ncbi:MAG: class I SAM-dependent methyltransferase, partial [Acidimicrobiales bacterium]
SALVRLTRLRRRSIWRPRSAAATMGAVPGSISFDRAVDYYDRTRSFSPDALREVTRILAEELMGRGPCLEIGVGTGRVALPLCDVGISVAGIDVSEPMLRRLVAKSRGGPPLLLSVADATGLPFADASLGGALACHVLHLIPNWKDAVEEIVRVVRPGGVFLVDPGGGPRGPWGEIFSRVSRQLGMTEPRVGLKDGSELDALMVGKGVTVRKLPEVLETVRRPLSDALGELQDQIHAWTWAVPSGDMAAAVNGTRDWAIGRFGDLEKPRDVEKVIAWRAYGL